MCEELKKKIGWQVCVGHKRPNNIFFYDGTIMGVSETHLFLRTVSGEQALLLTEISKIEFKTAPANTGAAGRC